MKSNLSGSYPAGTLEDNPVVKLSFTPSASHIEQIRQWLIHEKENFNDGFYCNWSHIARYFEHGLMAVLLRNEMAIGFLTYRLSSDFSATIELCEISREYRLKGYGKLLAEGFLCYLQDSSVYTADLLSEPISSKHFWQHMGFTKFPPLEVYYNSPGRHFYKILVNTQRPVYTVLTGEFISVWAMESPSEAIPANWVWAINRAGKNSTSILPIVHPIDDQWQIQWKNEGNIIYCGSIRNFKAKALNYGSFLILSNLPIL